MRLPNHIILDLSSLRGKNSSKYWVLELNNSQLNNDKPFLSSKFFLEKITIKTKANTRFNKKHSLKFKNNLNKNLLIFLGINKQNTYNNNYFSPLSSILNINFLRKERLYTKLKYSRTPAYDSVSGGAALLFAGLLGFLTSEKFGIELVDSGDFYYLFMYLVFLSFSLKPILTSIDRRYSIFYALNPKHIFNFYKLILILFFKK